MKALKYIRDALWTEASPAFRIGFLYSFTPALWIILGTIVHAQAAFWFPVLIFLAVTSLLTDTILFTWSWRTRRRTINTLLREHQEHEATVAKINAAIARTNAANDRNRSN